MKTIASRCLSWIAVLYLAAFAASAHGQVVFQPAGVYIDAKGVLRARQKDKPIARRRPGRAHGRCYVSLPRIFDEARRHVEAGTPIPEEVRYLNGIVKLQHVFVFPEENDLVIAGPAEKWDASDPRRPIGVNTGRPVLRLEDLVVALRTIGPGRPNRPIGCSIDLPPDALSKVQRVASQIGRSRQLDRVAQTMADAVGLQPVRIFSLPKDSNFALVCLEADFELKRLSLGLRPSPVRAVRSHVSMMRKGEGSYNRFWFVPNYEPLLVNEKETAFALKGQGLKVQTSVSSKDNNAGVSPAAKRFAEQLTEHFVDVAHLTPSFADLWNLTDVAVLASLISHDRLHQKAGWDPTWILSEYPVQTAPTPDSVETLAVVGPRRFVAIGGVVLQTQDVAAAERVVDISVEEYSRRPSETWQLQTPLN